MQSQIEHNKELARRFYMEEVWVQGKLDLLDEFVAPEILDLGMGILFLRLQNDLRRSPDFLRRQA